MLKKLDCYFEQAICVVCISVVACSVFLQVIMRFVFSSAFVWAEEIAIYGMIFAVYFGASLSVKERAHIRITVLINAVPRSLQIFLIVLADLLWLGFIVFMIVQTTEYTKFLFEMTYITPGLGIERRWVQLLLPITLTLLAFRIGQVYWYWRKTDWKGLPL